jgi:chorismate mutase
MTDENYEKIIGRISALEMLMIVNEVNDLMKRSGDDILKVAEHRAAYWRKIGEAIKDNGDNVIDNSRVESFERLGKLLMLFAEPIAEQIGKQKPEEASA